MRRGWGAAHRLSGLRPHFPEVRGPVRRGLRILAAVCLDDFEGEVLEFGEQAHRRSYARRTGAERGFATVKDPAASDIARGWCRLMSLAPLMLFTTCLLAVRNQRVLTAWNARQEENQRRAAKGQPPKTRRRRRKTLAALTATSPP